MIKHTKIYRSPGIYKLLNRNNGNFYVGSSMDVYKRMYSHQTLLKNNKHPNIHLQRAWNKYGQEVFEYIVLEYVNVSNERALHKIEQKYLDNLSPVYNISKDAISPLSTKQFPRTISHINKVLPQRKETWEEVKMKISKTVKSLWADDIFREHQISCMNSPKAKENRSKSLKVRWGNVEYRESTIGKMLLSLEQGKNKSSNLSKEDVLEIRNLAENGASLKDIESIYGESRRVIWRIITRRTWKFI